MLQDDDDDDLVFNVPWPLFKSYWDDGSVVMKVSVQNKARIFGTMLQDDDDDDLVFNVPWPLFKSYWDDGSVVMKVSVQNKTPYSDKLNSSYSKIWTQDCDLKSAMLITWAQLFKTNDVVS